MATITVDDKPIEAPEGAPLLEVLRKAGIYVPSLCYLEGLPPYGGCRMCLVEIDGAPGLQLACTSRVSDGMIVRTGTPEVVAARRAVLSLIVANHSDRCLTCHRVVHCRPGDTCLRDNLVTHRCLTCCKDYRCDLQLACYMVGMKGYEPWLDEARTYYRTEPPPGDRANPFLEFDPQMCILCTRCVRACDEIRHTGAITLAERGWETHIAFGAGGAVHESNCDFCGACINVCPTATLMEKPNKWAASQTEGWVSTACAYCSVGCTISLGVKKGRAVIVRPEPSNPVSDDQLCIRGCFHYDAIRDDDRLAQPLLRRDGELAAASWDQALESAASRLAAIREEHGPEAIAFLGSPFATNEENYLLQKLARAVVGSNNVGSSGGAVIDAVAQSLRRAFATDILPADMTDLAKARTIVVVADDLESTHNVACLRVKDAVVRNGARLIVVTPRSGELCDFAEVWLRPNPGQEAHVLAALAHALLQDEELVTSLKASPPAGLEDLARASLPDLSDDLADLVGRAALALADSAKQPPDDRRTAIVYAVPHLGAQAAGRVTAAVANLAILCCGPQEAARSLFVLPPEVNGWGLQDMGVTPGLLPGYRPVDDEGARQEVEKAWGASPPSAAGLGFRGALDAIQEGRIKAMVVLADNPLFVAPDKASLRACLSSLDFLLVIDSVLSDTARMAQVVLPDVSVFGKDGTYTIADRRILRLRGAVAPIGQARPAWRILAELGSALAQGLGVDASTWEYASPDQIMDDIASLVPLYRQARYSELESGAQQDFAGTQPQAAVLQPPALEPTAAGEGLVLTASRTLYTSWEGAAIHSPEADKLHREEFVEMNAADAAGLGVEDGQEVILANERGELTIRVKISDSVLPGSVFVPLYYDGGAVTALLGHEDGALARVRIAVRARA
ncbi:MAG: molybdopterin-dependent oxidoreductase [Dehalococcoidia bacterium]|nr:MAG: molybdopterin-dependent oxidoreductase [Dehalococcoidia bacterium]